MPILLQVIASLLADSIPTSLHHANSWQLNPAIFGCWYDYETFLILVYSPFKHCFFRLCPCQKPHLSWWNLAFLHISSSKSHGIPRFPSKIQLPSDPAQALLRIEREHVQQLQHQLLEAEATARLPEARSGRGAGGGVLGRIRINPPVVGREQPWWIWCWFLEGDFLSNKHSDFHGDFSM